MNRPNLEHPAVLARRTLCLSSSLLALCVVAPSIAQAQAASTGAGTEAVTEVVITGLKRDTTVQKAPVSVTTISGETLRASGMENIGDLTAIPGLTAINAGSSNTRLVIRGVQAVGEATVGVYYDEAPVTGMVGATNDAGGNTPGLKLFDVSRAEVLRGPQGTLYGSGAMSGALRVIYNKPVPTFQAAVEAEGVARDGATGGTIEAMVNLPLNDKLALRVVAFAQKNPGYIDDTSLGIRDANVEHVTGGRLMARAWLTPNLTVDAAIFHQRTRGDRPIWIQEQGAYNADHRSRLPNAEDFTLSNLTARWDLGSVTATAVASYEDRKLDQAVSDPSFFFQTDINNPAVCSRLRGGGALCSPDMQTAFNAYVRQYTNGVLLWGQGAHQPSLELRLSSNGERRFGWTVGGFFSDRTGDVDISQWVADPLTGKLIQPRIVQSTRLVKDELKQAAIFGDAAFKITEKLTASGGARYYEYDRSVGGATTVPLDLINARLSAYTTVKSKSDGWVSRVNLSYQATSAVMAYVQAAQGFRPGGVNQVLGLPAALGPYRPDSLWSYEAGLKTRSFENRLTFNVDAYRIDWKDMQVTGMTTSGPFSFISNAGAAQIDGGEAELSFSPSSNLFLQANTTYAKARLSEDQINTNIIATGRAGDRIPYVPKLSGALSAQYTRPISHGLTLVARADASFIGKSFSELRPTNAFYRELPAYSLVRLKLGLEGPTKRWSGYVFVDNLLDEVAIVSSTANAITVGRTTVTSAPPRTFGFNLRRDF
jgi:iron complex outermembrane receptor protein